MSCAVKSWKVRDRKTYLAGKKRYRQKNKEKLLEYNRENRKHELPGHIRNFMTNEDDKCQKCGGINRLNIHHIKPIKLGGTHEFNNLIIFCWDCHMLWHKFIKGFWV